MSEGSPFPLGRHLTEEDLEEVFANDDWTLGEFNAWLLLRGTQRWFEHVKSLHAARERPAERPPNPITPLRRLWEAEREAKSKRRKAAKDKVRHADNAAERKAARAAARETEAGKAREGVRKEAATRLRRLLAGTRKPRGCKRLEQFRGQERVYVNVWHATAIARLEQGLGVSADKIAVTYGRLFPDERSITGDVVRGRSKVIAKLEEPGGVWALRALRDDGAGE